MHRPLGPPDEDRAPAMAAYPVHRIPAFSSRIVPPPSLAEEEP